MSRIEVAAYPSSANTSPASSISRARVASPFGVSRRAATRGRRIFALRGRGLALCHRAKYNNVVIFSERDLMNTVRIDRPTDDVAVITLNRPEQLNAITFELVDDLHAALDAVDRDNTCRVVVLTGEGRGFCSGLDLKSIGPSSMSTGLSASRAGMRSQEHIANLVPHLRSIQQPVIAAINGAAYGGGLALACACDIRVVAESARMCVQFIRVGIGGCDIGISYTLPRLIGVSRAHDLILTARTIDGVRGRANRTCESRRARRRPCSTLHSRSQKRSVRTVRSASR